MYPGFWFEPAMLNLGDLQRRGISLSTHEVITIVRVVCEQLGRAQRSFGTLCPPTPDDLTVDRRGELLMRAQPAGVDVDPRPALASLIDALLPEFSEFPDYEVPAALRLIPARLRGEAGAPAITSFRELEQSIERYDTDDPRRVLQQLVVRVASMESVPSAQTPVNEAADLSVSVQFDAEDPLESFPTEGARVARHAVRARTG